MIQTYWRSAVKKGRVLVMVLGMFKRGFILWRRIMVFERGQELMAGGELEQQVDLNGDRVLSGA